MKMDRKPVARPWVSGVAMVKISAYCVAEKQAAGQAGDGVEQSEALAPAHDEEAYGGGGDPGGGRRCVALSPPRC